jgi:hypothetical protein
MRFLRAALSISLCCLLIQAKGNVFTKVRYNGGSFESKVSPHDWDNKLTVTPATIVLDMHDKEHTHFEIPSKSVTSLSYGQEAHRRVGTMIALAILVAPVALFGLFHKTRLHFIGIQYKLSDGKMGGVLLQGDKDNYRGILVALQGVTGAPVSVAEKEREFVPVGITAEVTKGSDDTATEPTAPATSVELPVPAPPGTVSLIATPDSADIYVDGQFYGNSPATLRLAAGKHTIAVKALAYKDWSRDVTVGAGSDVHLRAALDKE